MEHLENDMASHQMGRRELLKALAAGGGAIAVTAIVPGKWAKPVIEAGLLPAHAQASPTAVPTAFYGTPVPCSLVDGSNIILAIDRSSSMDQPSDKIIKAREAAQGFVDRIDFNKDKVGIVSYSSDVTVDYSLGTNGDEAKKAIASISPYGATDIAGAVRKSRELLANSLQDGKTPVLVLLTDGKQTVSGDPVTEANTAKQNGVHIITIGLGNDVEDEILRRMASSENDYHRSPTPDELDGIYRGISNEFCDPNARRRWEELRENNMNQNSSNRGSSASPEDDPIGDGPSN